MSETVKSRRKREDMPVRKEAEDFRQARGMDTQAMVPVLAAIASILSMLCFRWVSVPALLPYGLALEAGGDGRGNCLELRDAGQYDGGSRSDGGSSADRHGG